MSDKNFGNVAGGFKATLNNPKASDEAKQRAQQALDQFSDPQFAGDQDFVPSSGDKNTGNVLGGHKANLRNPKSSDESKAHSQSVIDELGDAVDEFDREKNPGNVAGGLKATLKNPRVSEVAKEKARQALDEFQS